MSVIKNGLEYKSTSAEVAAALDKTVNWVQELARSGKLPSVRVGGRYRFNIPQVLEIMVDPDPSGTHQRDKEARDVDRSTHSFEDLGI